MIRPSLRFFLLFFSFVFSSSVVNAQSPPNFEIALTSWSGQPNAPDESATSNVAAPPFLAHSLNIDLGLRLDGWKIAVRFPWVSISVLQPASSTLTYQGFGNLFVDAQQEFSSEEIWGWVFHGTLRFGVGVPFACLGDEDPNCDSALILSDALTGWTRPELYQRDALPMFVEMETRFEKAEWKISSSIRVPIFMRYLDDSSSLRENSSFGLLPTLELAFQYSPASWFSVGMASQIAMWAPRLVRPQGESDSEIQLTTSFNILFSFNKNVALEIVSTVSPGGSLDGSYSVGLGMRLGI